MEIEIKEIFDKYVALTPNLTEFTKLLQDFSKKWDLTSSEVDQLLIILEDASKEFINLQEKGSRVYKKCIFYGRTSTGKSAIINKLLGENLLPTGFGSTSNRIVEIKGSSTPESFIFFRNEEDVIRKEDASYLKIEGKVLPIKDRVIPIKLFYSIHKSEILANNFSIFDTPGLGKGAYEQEISGLCGTADLTILVISSLSELGSLEKDILLKSKNYFSKYKTIVVFNFCDVIHGGQEFEEICHNQEKAAKSYFNDLKINEDPTDLKKVFFLSGVEKDESQFTDEISLNKFKTRQNMFNEFKQKILDEMSEMDYFRKLNIIKSAEDILDELYTKLKDAFTNLMTETSTLVEKIKSEMSGMENLVTLNTQVNKEVDIAFKMIGECVIKNGKKAVDCKNEAKSLSLEKIINETVENEIEKLRQKVIELINGTECTDFCKNVLTEIYFKKYFSYKADRNKNDDADIMDNLLKIKKSDEIKTSFKSGMKSAKAVAAVASGGISVGVTAAIDAASGVASLVTGKNISVSSFLKFIKKPFHFIWDREEENIKKHFTEIKDNLKDSIIKLPERIESDINQITDPLKEEIVVLQQNYDEEKRNIEIFREKSFIYM